MVIFLEDFPNSKMNNGIIERFDIQALPSIFIVNPEEKTAIPIAYGLVSVDQIEENILRQFKHLERKTNKSSKLSCSCLSLRHLIAILLFLPSLLLGALKEDLNKFFDSMGANANVSAGDVYQGQKAGYATGGGVSIRNPSINTKLATVNLPEFDAGCGGIDIHLVASRLSIVINLFRL